MDRPSGTLELAIFRQKPSDLWVCVPGCPSFLRAPSGVCELPFDDCEVQTDDFVWDCAGRMFFDMRLPMRLPARLRAKGLAERLGQGRRFADLAVRHDRRSKTTVRGLFQEELLSAVRELCRLV